MTSVAFLLLIHIVFHYRNINLYLNVVSIQLQVQLLTKYFGENLFINIVFSIFLCYTN